VNLNIYLHLQPRLRMGVAIFLIPVCSFMIWLGITLTWFISYTLKPYPKIKSQLYTLCVLRYAYISLQLLTNTCTYEYINSTPKQLKALKNTPTCFDFLDHHQFSFIKLYFNIHYLIRFCKQGVVAACLKKKLYLLSILSKQLYERNA